LALVTGIGFGFGDRASVSVLGTSIGFGFGDQRQLLR